jgi:hypothetical protein
MRRLLTAVAVLAVPAALSTAVPHSAQVRVAESGYTPPHSLTIEAATETIRVCESHTLIGTA